MNNYPVASQAPRVMVKSSSPGGMAEWFKATDLKSVVAARSPGVRIPLPPPCHLPGLNNCTWGGAREADWARLLSECWDLKLSRGFESRPPRYEETLSNLRAFRFPSAAPSRGGIRGAPPWGAGRRRPFWRHESPKPRQKKYSIRVTPTAMSGRPNGLFFVML